MYQNRKDPKNTAMYRDIELCDTDPDKCEDITRNWPSQVFMNKQKQYTFCENTLRGYGIEINGQKWIECSNCGKWRKIPQIVNIKENWQCSDNLDENYNSCDKPQEYWDPELEGLISEKIRDTDVSESSVIDSADDIAADDVDTDDVDTDDVAADDVSPDTTAYAARRPKRAAAIKGLRRINKWNAAEDTNSSIDYSSTK